MIHRPIASPTVVYGMTAMADLALRPWAHSVLDLSISIHFLLSRHRGLPFLSSVWCESGSSCSPWKIRDGNKWPPGEAAGLLLKILSTLYGDDPDIVRMGAPICRLPSRQNRDPDKLILEMSPVKE